MFRKVQLKFFGIITAILIIIFIGVLSSVNIIMDVLMERQIKGVLQQAAAGVEYNSEVSTFTFVNPNRRKNDKPKRDEIPPLKESERNGSEWKDKQPPMPHMDDMVHGRFEGTVPKSLGSIEFFVIMADENGKYAASLNNDELTEETAQEYIDKIIRQKNKAGMTGTMSFFAEKKDNGTLMVLTDRTAEMGMMRKLKRTTLIVGIVSVIFLSAAAYFLSGLIVRPLKDTFEKQKQFISDAGHELKTPLTVISTNADVLSGEIGENKWLKYIQDQTDRMNVLVNDLLSLTRLENSSREFITTEFDLSRAVTNAALPFECQAFENRKNFVLNIEDGIRITASEQHIKQMTGIFIDNALKYSKDGGTVRVSLTREDGKAVLSVYNTGYGVREEEVDKLFERFYRSDESRNRSTGGYGLGLAIAKSIIDKHKFKVQVENQEGRSICFVVTMGGKSADRLAAKNSISRT